MSAANLPRLFSRVAPTKDSPKRLRPIISKIKGYFRSYHLWIVAPAAIGIPAVLAYLGFRATEEWQRTTRMLMEQRTSEVVTLMVMALNHDMRAVQGEVLPQLESLNSQPSLYDLSDEITTAFARFPYPESFFTWKAGNSSQGELYAFDRTDRPPPWYGNRGYGKNAGIRRFPTTILKDPQGLRPLIGSLRKLDRTGSHVLVLNTQFGGSSYQVIARARYGSRPGAGIESLVGFLVNLSWVRVHYFPELVSQLSKVLAADSGISMTIYDDRGAMVGSSPTKSTASNGLPPRDQRFPLLFLDPLLRPAAGDDAVPVSYWTARAQPLQDESLLAASQSASRTFVLIAVAALAAGAALFFAIFSARAAAVLAAMKSEFISSVTHELKTPLSSIRLASETLVRGRYRSREVIVQYAEMLLNEVSRLTRTVDNLLAITRMHDVNGFYYFESVDLLTVIEEALSRFELQLREREFEVHLDLPSSLPPVHADRTAILQVLENLLDNAIRYCNGSRFLEVSACSSARNVSVRVTDKGPGIPQDELPRVFDKFFRGRGTSTRGSGLGLAIAERVMKDHGGSIRLHSALSQGTTAELILCVAAGAEEA